MVSLRFIRLKYLFYEVHPPLTGHQEPNRTQEPWAHSGRIELSTKTRSFIKLKFQRFLSDHYFWCSFFRHAMFAENVVTAGKSGSALWMPAPHSMSGDINSCRHAALHSLEKRPSRFFPRNSVRLRPFFEKARAFFSRPWQPCAFSPPRFELFLPWEHGASCVVRLSVVLTVERRHFPQ